MPILRIASPSFNDQKSRFSALASRLSKIPFFIKLFNWEYWPMYITQFPVLIFWLTSALRTGKLSFFTAVNPAIETGGLFGESKIKILRAIPSEFLPKTLFFTSKESEISLILEKMRQEQLRFPIIAKPDIGERGMLVKKIGDEIALKQYLQQANYDFLIQEYIDYPLELSVLCYRIPNSKEGAITSICQKEFLSVLGDGESTLATLIEQQPRAILQKKNLFQKHYAIWEVILPKNQRLYLQPIGNHCKGTKFLNANAHIDEDLTQLFLSVLDKMPNIHYGRFDLRAESWEVLKENHRFKVLEFNGVGSEPAHIYDPEYSIWKAYRDIWRHWKIMVNIYREQELLGYRALSFRDLWRDFKAYRSYIRNVE